MSLTAYCRSDLHQRVGAAIDPTPILGTWVNLNRETVHFLSVTLTRSREGFRLSAQMARGSGVLELAPVPARVCVADGTEVPLGFTARFRTEDADLALSANQTQGICVVQTYTQHRGRSVGTDFFTKEFYRLGSTSRGGAHGRP